MSVIDGWQIDSDGEATCVAEKRVTCCIKDGALLVDDDEQYYPSGCYSIPLTVIRELERLAT